MLFLLHISSFRKTKKSHKVLERTKLPNKCITEVSGALVFQEQNDLVYPLLDFPEEDINKYSRKIIGSHSEQLRHARVIMQVTLQTHHVYSTLKLRSFPRRFNVKYT